MNSQSHRAALEGVIASIIMPTYNRAPYLELTLASYLNCKTDRSEATFEIIVIDDGGTDETCQIAQRYSETLPVRYMRQSHSGRAAARNAGIGDLK